MLLENYVHFTSPIRRLVDLLNQIYVWPLIGLSSDNKLSTENPRTYTGTSEMSDFLEKWTSSTNMCYINDTMKSIRRTQTSCELVYMCYNNRDILQTYTGVVFDKTSVLSFDNKLFSDNSRTPTQVPSSGVLTENDQYEYTVFIKALKYLAHIKCDKNIAVFTEVECMIFVFHDKITVSDKIVLQIL